MPMHWAILPGQIRYEKKLYSGMVATFVFPNAYRKQDDLHTTVMVVGHNPTIYYYIDYLLPDFSLDVPTCSDHCDRVLTLTIGPKLRERSGTMIHRWIPDML